ncbi:hypothetical protein GCM10023208_08310 [Erythrobacter westpacificensis]|uniref:Uncharacterized protein n=1 Tax=Erythrobacter westpacificensis TaxID=1055231 RepID=A0ABP9K290_9SPHN
MPNVPIVPFVPPAFLEGDDDLAEGWTDWDGGTGKSFKARCYRKTPPSYSDQSADPWALQLTHFRNLHLHREPIGSGGERDCLRYKVIECGDRSYPLLTYLISDQEKYYSGQDYLKSFFDIYTKISNFAKRVARSAHISCDYPKVTFPKAGER